MICPECGASAVEGMEGGAYTSHMHDCPFRRRFVPPRRTLRSRGGELIADARWKLVQVNWWAVLAILILIVVVGAAMDLFFNWLETYERAWR